MFRHRLKLGKLKLLRSAFGRFYNYVRLRITKLGHFMQRKLLYWAVIIVLALIICLAWQASRVWLVQSSFSQSATYANTFVLGNNVGKLNHAELDDKLLKIKADFDSQKVTLVNNKDRWTFETAKIGMNFDTKATSQAVWHLNNLGFIEKYDLLYDGVKTDIAPTISSDNETCVKALSVIPSIQTEPVDASIYYDNGFKVKPDQSGYKLDVALTCQSLPKKLASNAYVSNVALDIAPAGRTAANLEPKLTQINAMAGKSLSLKSGAYQQTLTPQQLFDMLDIAGNGSDVNVNWSQNKVDDLVNGIADKVNTYSQAPAVGGCQYVSSAGGTWLDKEATKKIFTDLGADKPRSYDLAVSYHAPVVSNISPVSHNGNKTIFLTFDDGMTYADQIMNFASCYGVKVTFFEIGGRVNGDAAGLRRAIAEGHAVQSHGFEHAMYDYGQRSYEWQNNDISQSISAIMGVTGVRPTYFRPPGGNKSSSTYQAAAANGVKLIMWDDPSRDATVGGLSSAQTCANVLAGAYDGASVLMHSTHYSTAMAFPCIVEGLASRGYNMVALR